MVGVHGFVIGCRVWEGGKLDNEFNTSQLCYLHENNIVKISKIRYSVEPYHVILCEIVYIITKCNICNITQTMIKTSKHYKLRKSTKLSLITH